MVRSEKCFVLRDFKDTFGEFSQCLQNIVIIDDVDVDNFSEFLERSFLT